jgi:L-ascorbate metabolism protein UlaG (beta-lactamase superfamily)
MEITWFGHSCFRLSENNFASVVIDPYDHTEVGYKPLKLQADIVTTSHDAPGHNHLAAVAENPFVITGPGEYEIGNVFITGVQTTRQNQEENSQRNTLYVYDYDGIVIAHLGNLNRIPGKSEVEILGSIDIVLIPVGGGQTLSASKAAEVVRLLEPKIVIPMHYSTPESLVQLEPSKKFLKEMGLTDVETIPSLKMKRNASFPEELQVVVLTHHQG